MAKLSNAALSEDYRRGLSLQQVGRLHGVSGVAVFKRLRKHGVRLRPAGRPRGPIADVILKRAAGLTYVQISAQDGRSPCYLGQLLARAGAKGDLSSVLRLSPAKLGAYRAAIDEDHLTHPEALDIAAEY